MRTTSSRKWINEQNDCLSEMIVVLHIVVLCRFTLRSYAANVVPASYAWSTFTGPVSGEVQEIKPLRPSSSSSSFPGFENENDESNSYPSDYVAKPQYSFAYGVENPNTGESHGHSETRDGATVTGEYSVMEPDGVLRRVQYTADPKNGFRASVRYVRPDGEETPSRDHGFQSGQNRVPASRPSSLLSEYESDHEEPFNIGSPQTSEYEPDGDGPFAAMPSPLPLNFGFDKYNSNNHVNDNNDDDDSGDYRDDSGPQTFKFPSSPPASNFFKGSANAADSDDYGDNDKYRPWGGTFGSPPTPFDDGSVSFGHGPSPSQAPFSLASSLSPSFGVAPQSQQHVAFPGLPSSPVSEPPPCRSLVSDRLPPARRPPLSVNVANFQTNHANRFAKQSADDDDDNDPERFRSAQVDIEAADGDDDNEDIENYESDDNDTDNAQQVTDVQVSPSSSSSAKSQPPSPQPLPSQQPPSSTPPTPGSPLFAATPSSQPVVAQGLSSTPAAIITPVVPTVVHVDH